MLYPYSLMPSLTMYLTIIVNARGPVKESEQCVGPELGKERAPVQQANAIVQEPREVLSEADLRLRHLEASSITLSAFTDEPDLLRGDTPSG